MADICRNFGIDINLLDQALAGQAQPPQQAQPQQQFRDPRFDELMSRLQNGERQKQQAASQRAVQEVEEFAATAEFYGDVRQEMADILEVKCPFPKRTVGLSGFTPRSRR